MDALYLLLQCLHFKVANLIKSGQYLLLVAEKFVLEMFVCSSFYFAGNKALSSARERINTRQGYCITSHCILARSPNMLRNKNPIRDGKKSKF